MNKRTKFREDNLIVKPRKENWIVTADNESPVSYQYKTKHRAVQIAQEIAMIKQTNVIIENKNGLVQDSFSYG